MAAISSIETAVAGAFASAITTLSGKTYHGRMFIDATYVGDLLAAMQAAHS